MDGADIGVDVSEPRLKMGIGVRRQLDPGTPFRGDTGHRNPDETAAVRTGCLSRTSHSRRLDGAIAAFEGDEVVPGAAASEHFLRVRRNGHAQ